METMEYRKLLMLLDGQIEEARKVAEERTRREGLEQQLKLVKHQIEGLETRKTQLEKLGMTASGVDISGILTKLEGEKDAVERQLAGPVPVEGGVPALRLSEEDKIIASDIIDEITNTNSQLNLMAPEERWMQIEIWSVRWRILADKVGSEVTQADTLMRTCFRIIREHMTDPAHEPGHYIDALNKEKVGDWPVRQRYCEDRLRILVQDRHRAEEIAKAAEEAARVSEEAMKQLTDQVTIFERLGNDANERLFRHHVRHAAKFEHLRDEMADLLAPMRSKLEDEFGFLWKDRKEEEQPPEPAKKLSNRDIVTRILRKMRSKGLIGASHGPWDGICKGFPDHDRGRAKEAIDILVKSGILRKKPTLIGPRISIEPKMIGYVDNVINGKLAGVSTVDDWCDQT